MKVLSASELELLCEDAARLIGGQLQEVTASERDVELEIYVDGDLYSLWIDLQPASPFLICLVPTEPRPPFKKKSTPVSLFLKAHGRGRRLSSLQRTEGRMVELTFGDPKLPDELLCLSLRLFPHGQNAIVQIGKKKIAWLKPKELGLAHAEPHMIGPVRTRDELFAAWMLTRNPTAAVGGAISRNAEKLQAKEKAREKLETILVKLEAQLASWQNHWRTLGEWLKENQSLNVPAELRSFMDKDAINLAAHVQAAFTLAKKQDQKQTGIERRVRELKYEITKSLDESAAAPTAAFSKANVAETNSLFHKSSSRGRRAQLTEQVDLFVGKSAVDNLSLLRQAQSWDYWLHVKDVPGCHAILRRPKGHDIGDDLLRTAARKVVEFSPQASRNFREGDQFDVTICEVRFVKPIKGDRLGQVTYHNDRTIRVRM